MQTKLKTLFPTLLFLFFVGSLGCQSKTASFPNRDITLVVQSAPGGGSDFTSRTIAQAAEKYLGVKINVINKPGGSGSIGMGSVATSNPDGYTIGFVPVELSIIKHLGYTDIEPSKFELIMLATKTPAAFSVRVDSPYKTLKDLVEDARKRPGEISVSNSGTGSIWHLAASGFEKSAGVQFKHVPFGGGAPALVAALGGHVDVAASSPAEALSHVQAGKMRLLAVMDDKRFEKAPEVPTAKEQGFDVEIMAWGGFAAPRGTPKQIVQILHDAFKKAFEEESVKTAYQRQGMGHEYLDSASFTNFAEQQANFFSSLVASLGLNQKESYPTRPITLVCPVSPGGISDFVSRTVAAYAEKHLGQRINVINKPGGTASIGLEMVATSKPDGYQIGYAPGVVSGLQYLGYSHVKPEQFDTIMLAVTMPAAITVRADSPYHNINDFIEAAKQKPSQLVIANAGTGSPWHMSAVALEKKTGTTFKHVPFDGSAPALVALLGGHADAAATAPSETLAHVKAGKLRVLGVMDHQRFEPLKEVPTFKEQGIDLVVIDWGGFVAPKGIPSPVLETLRAAFKQAFDQDEVKALYAKQGLGYRYLSGSDFEKFASDQTGVFKEMIANAGLAK